MSVVIIVEGKNDRKQLRKIVNPDVRILCTMGTPGAAQLYRLKKEAGELDVYVFTDNDSSGKKIRALLSDTFPDAEHLYTRRGYAGVEGTPEEHLYLQLEKAGLDEYLLALPADPPFVLYERQQESKRRQHAKDN